MVQTVKQREVEVGSSGFGTQIAFESLTEPGAYVCNWSGHLLRVPEDSLKPGRSPLMNLSANQELFVTKISDNPYLARSKARILAANSDLPVDF